MGNIVVWLLKTLTSSVAGVWSSVLAAILGFVVLITGMTIRPGEEKWSDFLALVAGVLVISSLVIAFGLKSFDYVTDVATLSGFILTAGNLFIAEALFLKVKKALRL